MLESMSEGYLHMKNTLPESAGGNTQNLVGFFIYIIPYVPVILFVPQLKLEPLMRPAFIGTMGVVFGIMGYAVGANGGSAGNMVSPAIAITSSNRGFRFIQCISTVVGTYEGAFDRFSDWTRFSKNKNSHIIGTILGIPIIIILCSLLGVITASASKAHYGKTYKQPPHIPPIRSDRKIHTRVPSSAFLFVNSTQNNITAGMDLAGGFPRYILMKRDSLILCTLGVLCQPWRFFTQAAVFLSVIGLFGVVTGPTTAILILDYYSLRKGNGKIPDVFNGGPSSIYWYYKGVNFRAIVPYIFAIIPSMPGLMENIMERQNKAVKIYQLNYMVAFGISAILFFTACKLFPPPGTDMNEPFEDWEGSVTATEGQEASGSDGGSGIKTPTKGGLVVNEKSATEVVEELNNIEEK